MADEAKQIDFLISGSILESGEANDSGRVYFFTTGGTTTKAVYSDKEKTSFTTETDSGGPHDGEKYILLDSGGRPTESGTLTEVFADGTYDIYIYDSSLSLLATITKATYSLATVTASRTASVETTNFNVDGTKDIYFVSNTVNATFTVNLDDVAAGTRITIVNTDTGTVTLVRKDSDTFNGLSTWDLDKQYEAITLESQGTGSNWVVTGGITPNDIPLIEDQTNANHDHSDASGGGDVTLNTGSSATWDVLPDGAVVQVVNFQTGVNSTGGAATIEGDDSIPQIDEGDQYMTLAITPKATTNKIKIEVTVNCSHSAVDNILSACLFNTDKHATNAFAIGSTTTDSANNVQQVTFTYYGTASEFNGTTTTTFRVRCGSTSAGTFNFNPQKWGQDGFDVIQSSITITEIKAS